MQVHISYYLLELNVPSDIILLTGLSMPCSLTTRDWLVDQKGDTRGYNVLSIRIWLLRFKSSSMEWRNAGEPSLTLCLLGLFKWPFDDGDDHVREPSPTLCLPELFKWPFPVNGQLNFLKIQTFSIFFPYDGFLLQFFFSGKAGSLLKLKMKIMRGRTSAFVEDISNMRLVAMKKMWKLIELKNLKLIILLHAGV